MSESHCIRFVTCASDTRFCVSGGVCGRIVTAAWRTRKASTSGTYTYHNDFAMPGVRGRGRGRRERREGEGEERKQEEKREEIIEIATWGTDREVSRDALPVFK